MKLALVAALALASPAISRECKPDEDLPRLNQIIQDKIGTGSDSAADWVARQAMDPQIYPSILQADPIFAAVLMAYDGAKAWRINQGCEDYFGPSMSRKN